MITLKMIVTVLGAVFSFIGIIILLTREEKIKIWEIILAIWPLLLCSVLICADDYFLKNEIIVFLKNKIFSYSVKLWIAVYMATTVSLLLIFKKRQR